MIAVASSPHPIWSEQDPREWWEAVSASIKLVLEKAGISGERIAAVGLTGQMHGLVLLDESGNVLRPAGAWVDVVSACKACVKITESTLPGTAQVDAYLKSYAMYQELYPLLKSSFAKM